jgi:hypothetical protein
VSPELVLNFFSIRWIFVAASSSYFVLPFSWLSSSAWLGVCSHNVDVRPVSSCFCLLQADLLTSNASGEPCAAKAFYCHQVALVTEQNYYIAWRILRFGRIGPYRLGFNITSSTSKYVTAHYWIRSTGQVAAIVIKPRQNTVSHCHLALKKKRPMKFLFVFKMSWDKFRKPCLNVTNVVPPQKFSEPPH